MFLVMLLVFLPVSLAAARSCPEIVRSTANGTYVVELKDRSCLPSFRIRYCTVYLHFNEANNEEWTVTQIACTSTCVASNTSGLGVHYMIGCCNSSLCASPSDFFDDIMHLSILTPTTPSTGTGGATRRIDFSSSSIAPLLVVNSPYRDCRLD